MKTKAIIVDISEVDSTKSNNFPEGTYGLYRIFIFEEESFNVLKNYLSSYGVQLDGYDDGYHEEYSICGNHYCSIVGEREIDRTCVDNLISILDKIVQLKVDKGSYDHVSYTHWLDDQLDINLFLED